MASDVIDVVFVDDHPILTQAVAGLLKTLPDFEVRTAANGPEAWEQYRERRPDVVLCDLSLGKPMSGIELTRKLVEYDPAATVVAFTSHADPDHVAAALDAGASGYLTKSTPPQELPARLRDAAAGLPCYDAQTQAIVVSLFKNRSRQPAHPLLTPRELEVLTLLCHEGGSTKEIADKLFTSEATVATHIRNIMTKLDVSNRPKAIAAAYRLGLVRPPVAVD
jgi:NarL family two-component system response regulator LiaR